MRGGKAVTFELHVQHNRTFYTHGQKSSSREDVTQMSDPVSAQGGLRGIFPSSVSLLFISSVYCQRKT